MSTQKIYGLIPKIMSEIGAVAKTRKNTHQNYSFRGIEDMYSAVHPAFIKFGVFCAPEVIDAVTSEIESIKSNEKKISYRTILRVRHRFYADDGSYVDAVTQGEGIDTSDKASNKAMSAAMKYAFIELFSIPTEDVADSDRESPEAGKSVGEARRVGPEQPPEDGSDGIFADSKWLFSFGKWTGKTLEQVYNDPANGPKEMANYINWIEDNSAKNKKPLTANAIDLIKHVEEFLGAMENRPLE